MNDELDPVAHVLVDSTLNVVIIVGWLLNPSYMADDLSKKEKIELMKFNKGGFRPVSSQQQNSLNSSHREGCLRSKVLRPTRGGGS